MLKRVITGAVACATFAAVPAVSAQVEDTSETKTVSLVEMGADSSMIVPELAVLTEPGNLDLYFDLVGLPEDDRRMMLEIADGARMEARRAAMRLMEDFRFEVGENADQEAQMKQFVSMAKSLEEDGRALVDRFFEDFELMLTADQLEAWDRVKLAHRRDSLMKPSAMMGGFDNIPGQSVDVVRLAHEQGMLGREDVEMILGEYERAIDRELSDFEDVKVDQLAEAERNAGAQQDWESDPEAAQKQWESFREKMRKQTEAANDLAEVNERYARRLAGTLSGDEKREFERAVREKTFPQVYGESMADGAYERVLSLGNLSDDQRAVVEALEESYRDRRSSIDEDWVEALIDERKASGNKSIYDEDYYLDEDGQYRQPKSMELWMKRFRLDREAMTELYGALDEQQRSAARVMDPAVLEQAELGSDDDDDEDDD